MERNNNLRQVRETQMLSKAELAKRAGISPLTIDRIEKGNAFPDCDFARKILLGFGTQTFGETQSL
jgi:DNA-binding XRE family transcriptional regulator